jgi:hypothetical protein
VKVLPGAPQRSTQIFSWIQGWRGLSKAFFPLKCNIFCTTAIFIFADFIVVTVFHSGEQSCSSFYVNVYCRTVMNGTCRHASGSSSTDSCRFKWTFSCAVGCTVAACKPEAMNCRK